MIDTKEHIHNGESSAATTNEKMHSDMVRDRLNKITFISSILELTSFAEKDISGSDG